MSSNLILSDGSVVIFKKCTHKLYKDYMAHGEGKIHSLPDGQKLKFIDGVEAAEFAMTLLIESIDGKSVTPELLADLEQSDYHLLDAAISQLLFPKKDDAEKKA